MNIPTKLEISIVYELETVENRQCLVATISVPATGRFHRVVRRREAGELPPNRLEVAEFITQAVRSAIEIEDRVTIEVLTK